MTPNPGPTPVAADQLPRHSASDGPVTRGYRIAYKVWLLCVLLTLVTTLVFYLIDKIWYAAGR
jgi:hypothetical protein